MRLTAELEEYLVDFETTAAGLVIHGITDLQGGAVELSEEARNGIAVQMATNLCTVVAA